MKFPFFSLLRLQIDTTQDQEYGHLERPHGGLSFCRHCGIFCNPDILKKDFSGKRQFFCHMYEFATSLLKAYHGNLNCNQSIKQSINQSINQSIHQSIYYCHCLG